MAGCALLLLLLPLGLAAGCLNPPVCCWRCVAGCRQAAAAAGCAACMAIVAPYSLAAHLCRVHALVGVLEDQVGCLVVAPQDALRAGTALGESEGEAAEGGVLSAAGTPQRKRAASAHAALDAAAAAPAGRRRTPAPLSRLSSLISPRCAARHS